MSFLLFTSIFIVAILTGWLYTTIDQKDDLDDHMRD